MSKPVDVCKQDPSRCRKPFYKNVNFIVAITIVIFLAILFPIFIKPACNPPESRFVSIKAIDTRKLVFGDDIVTMELPTGRVIPPDFPETEEVIIARDLNMTDAQLRNVIGKSLYFCDGTSKIFDIDSFWHLIYIFKDKYNGKWYRASLACEYYPCSALITYVKNHT